MLDVSLMDFIPSELLVMVVGLFIIGDYFKKLDKIKDEYIPLILFPLAIISSCLFLSGLTITNFYIGVAAWGIAIGISQVTIQSRKNKLNK